METISIIRNGDFGTFFEDFRIKNKEAMAVLYPNGRKTVAEVKIAGPGRFSYGAALYTNIGFANALDNAQAVAVPEKCYKVCPSASYETCMRCGHKGSVVNRQIQKQPPKTRSAKELMILVHNAVVDSGLCNSCSYLNKVDLDLIEGLENVQITSLDFEIVPSIRYASETTMATEVHLKGNFDGTGTRKLLIGRYVAPIAAVVELGILCGAVMSVALDVVQSELM